MFQRFSTIKSIHLKFYTMETVLHTTSLLALIYWLTFLDTRRIENCYEREGAMEIIINVMMDEGAILALTASHPKGYKHFFYEIFDNLNKELMPYGAQFLLDFSTVSTSSFTYDKTKCLEPNPAQTRIKLASKVLEMNGKNKIGNRIIVFYCPNNPNSALTGDIKRDDCTNILGFIAGRPKTLAQTIENSILDVVFRSDDRGSHFNDKICEYSEKCDGNAWGVYIPDLKAIRHIGSDKVILKEGDELGEHDLYDDMYLFDYVGKENVLKRIRYED